MQRIEFLATNEIKSTAYMTDRYELRRDRRFLWIQRIAIWALRKLGCFAVETNVTYVRHVINTDNLIEAIMKQRSEIMELYHRRGERILIGSQDYSELMMSADLGGNPVSFTAQYRYAENGKAQLFGMNVTVIPWMRGVLVVPKEEQPSIPLT